MNNYDVIIVGAGPAGCQCAIDLVKNNLKVVILEKQKEIGEPNFSTAGTPSSTLKDFNLPKEIALYSWKNLYIKSANREIRKNLEQNSGYVLDFRKLRQWLAEQAAKQGSEIAVGVNVKEPFFEDNRIAGVKYQGISSSGELKSKVVVDASGVSAVLNQKLNLLNSKKTVRAVGLEFQMSNINFPQDETLYMYLGDKYIPNGYGWVFPISKTSAKIGVGRHLKSGQIDLKAIIKNFIEGIEWLSTAQPIEFHTGTLAYDPTFSNYVRDSYLTIGTAASQVNPLGGEGIRHALYAGRLAAKIISEALSNGNTSKNKLSKFNYLWRKYSHNNWHECYRISNFYYSNTSDSRIDSSLELFKDSSGDKIFDILFNYKFQEFLPKFVETLATQKIKTLLDAI